MATILLTGATGMIGKGILLECLDHPQIELITLVNRSPVDIRHPKIREILLDDFIKIDSLKHQIGAIDGCFHCMGVSSIGMSEERYTELTFEVTVKLADICFDVNPDMTFNYVSGTGTDSSEMGRQMWTRVKGRTENYILSKGFGKSYMFRAGFVIPEKGIHSHTHFYDRIYTIMRPLFPILKKMNSVTTTTKMGRAMIKTLLEREYEPVHLENRDINRIAE